MRRGRVLLYKCDDYDPARLRDTIARGMRELDFTARGRVLLKPNVVYAHPRYSRYAYTEPRVTAAAVLALRDSGAHDLTVAESGAIGVPGRMLFKISGYYKMAREIGVPVLDFNEQSATRVPLPKGTVHRDFLASRPLFEADTKIWLPKLKYHITTTITQTLKLNIGILMHSERMIGHTEKLHEKIVDLLEYGYPDLIISDAVTIGHGFESCARPAHLGLILISDHPVASDVVAAHILGFDPRDVRHLAIASQRGYGSLDLADIDIGGDITIPELRDRTRDIVSDFTDLQKVDTPIRFYEGLAPDTDIVCDGGCATAVKGALGIIDAHTPGSLRNARPGAIVTGIYHGDVLHPGQSVLLVGDCTRVTGRIDAARTVHVRGCSALARDALFHMPRLFATPNPMLDLGDGWRFLSNMAARRLHRSVNTSLLGK